MMHLCKHHDVRTTLTLEEDIAKDLRREMRRTGNSSWKDAVNHFLRLGLQAARKEQRKPFVVRPLALGLPDFVKIEELLELLEGPGHK